MASQKFGPTARGTTMPRLLTIVICCLLSGCVEPPIRPVPSPEQIAAENEAIRAEVECERRNVPLIDDGTSDATTVALALALRCNAEYNAATEAVAAGLDNDAQRRMLRKKRSLRENRIEAFLPIVMQYRQTTKEK